MPKKNNNKNQKQQNPPPNNNQNKNGKKRRRRRRRRNYRGGPNYRLNFYARGVPAAQNYKTRSRTAFSSRRVNNLTISGYDLVYEIKPDDVLIDGAFVCIPANPAYWTGTRIANVATAYTNYRPLYLRFDYFPAVSTMTNGVITSGTVWNGIIQEGNLTQSLVTSNGGQSHPCYVRKTSTIRLGTNLNQNLFDMGGRLNDNSNPFIYLAVTSGVNGIVPGYFMAKYTYEFKNPIGDGNEYEHEVKTAGQITKDDVWENTSAVVLSEGAGLAPGVTLAITLINGVIQVLFKGSPVALLADTLVKIFRNRNRMNTKEYNGIGELMYISYAYLQISCPRSTTLYTYDYLPPNGYLNSTLKMTAENWNGRYGYYLIDEGAGRYALWFGRPKNNQIVYVFDLDNPDDLNSYSMQFLTGKYTTSELSGGVEMVLMVNLVVVNNGEESRQVLFWNHTVYPNSDTYEKEQLAVFYNLSVNPIAADGQPQLPRLVGTGRPIQRVSYNRCDFKIFKPASDISILTRKISNLIVSASPEGSKDFVDDENVPTDRKLSNSEMEEEDEYFPYN